jgi:maltose/maltodextrin transport system permease protein
MSMLRRWGGLASGVVVFLPLLYVDFLIYLSGNVLIAVGLLFLLLLAALVFFHSKGYVYRYLFPGLLGFALFVILPLVYTVYIGFTTYNASHLLTYQRVRQDFLSQSYEMEGSRSFRYELHPTGEPDRYRVLLSADEDASQRYLSEPVQVLPPAQGTTAIPKQPVPMRALGSNDVVDTTALGLAEITRPRLNTPLATLPFVLPDETPVGMTGLRAFSSRASLWREQPDGSMVSQQDQSIIRPDRKQGFYVDPAGDKVGFGFRTWSGLSNYQRILGDSRIKGPFFKIFLWTVAFAFLSVLTTLVLGMFLAVLLQWEGLSGRKLYRTMLILPYAVPAFLSILIFQGMFSQEFGAVNELLRAIFHTAPDWNTNPLAAKAMVLIVNLWLGYPYMMILCMGNLQSIPKAIYEASAIDGSNAWQNFTKLTVPLLIPPMVPVLIASFAFNFNNFNLIYLLTGGGPKMVGGTGIAGDTDILVTYTFNLAFRNSGADYGLASAIATVLFLIVGSLAWINLKAANRGK